MFSICLLARLANLSRNSLTEVSSDLKGIKATHFLSETVRNKHGLAWGRESRPQQCMLTGCACTLTPTVCPQTGIDCGRAADAAAPRALCETPQLPRDRFPLNYLPRARAIVLTKVAFLLPLIDKWVFRKWFCSKSLRRVISAAHAQGEGKGDRKI